ncbi:MAG: small subunit ribosomal protein S17 [Parcubacteria group bacterium Licking1014_17]|nr:MAG: small subunit ribosomal protein S17 [Parcubacteria group bacterium Licking1014_17]
MDKDTVKKVNKRMLKGIVVSDKMQKTVVVEVTRLVKNPKYKKYFKKSARYKAHDEKGDYHIGDKVIIQECRPMSKDKRWAVVNKV